MYILLLSLKIKQYLISQYWILHVNDKGKNLARFGTHKDDQYLVLIGKLLDIMDSSYQWLNAKET